MQIHISRDGQQYGPYTLDEVRAYLRTGQILPTDLAWYAGAAEWGPLSAVPGLQGGAGAPALPAAPGLSAGAAPAAGGVAYHHVSKLKFCLFSLVSFGLYELYWFYKNWKYIRNRDHSDIRPFWRAFFSPIWCHGLVKDIVSHGGPAAAGTLVWVPIVYFLLAVSWRLPDPYWLISLFSFIPLLPVVGSIHRLNTAAGARAPYYSRYGVGSILLSLLGAVCLVLSVMETLHLTPSTQVIPGEQLPARDREYLRAAKILEEGEQVLFFYSDNLFSIKSEGNVLTDRRVISYEKDAGDSGVTIASSKFADIQDIQVDRDQTESGKTVISITKGGDDDFDVTLSTEADADKPFVDRLMSMWKAVRKDKPAKPE